MGDFDIWHVIVALLFNIINSYPGYLPSLVILHGIVYLVLQEILEANNPSEDFCTIALRPHGIFGPRDPHFIPTLVNMAKRGGTLFKIGYLFCFTCSTFSCH